MHALSTFTVAQNRCPIAEVTAATDVNAYSDNLTICYLFHHTTLTVDSYRPFPGQSCTIILDSDNL